MRCCSPFPESLLRLPRRMNSCGENGPQELAGSRQTWVHTETLASSHHGPFHAKNHSNHMSCVLDAVFRRLLPRNLLAGTTGSTNRKETSTQVQWCGPGSQAGLQRCTYPPGPAGFLRRGRKKDRARYKLAARAQKTDMPQESTMNRGVFPMTWNSGSQKLLTLL